jgi:hypothetical protein
MRLGSLVILISIIYLMDFLCLQRDLETRLCREILYIRCTHTMRVLLCVFRMSIHWRSPPLHATDNSTFTFTSSIFKDTLYFLLKYVLPPVLLYSYSSRLIVN